MEILRKPPTPVTLELDGFEVGASIAVAIFSDKSEILQPDYFAKDDRLVLEKDNVFLLVADSDGAISLELPAPFSRYDREYALYIYDNSEGQWDFEGLRDSYLGNLMEDAEQDVVYTDSLRVYRPYIDIVGYAPEEELETYINVERMARTMIDNVTGGFYYKLQVVDLQGLGTDRLTVGDRVNKILELVENNVVVYQKGAANNPKPVTLNSDRNCIIPFVPKNEYHNRLDRRLPRVGSPNRYGSYEYDAIVATHRGEFPNGYNYTATLECGWPMVPNDIQDCMKILINDIICGVPNYWSKYIDRYDTKDFKVFFNSGKFDGTGNVYVDQVLQRYYGDQLYNNMRAL